MRGHLAGLNDIVRLRPRRRQHPFLHLLGLGVEHADGIAGIFGEPQTVALIHPSPSRPRIGNG
jgi:hypothetical protein